MLNIFIGDTAISNKENIIKDIEAFTPTIKLTDCSFVRKIIEEIEQGTYFDTRLFTDRTLGNLYGQHMSTTSKLLISIYNYPELIFLCDEMGENGLDYWFQLDKGNILINRTDFRIPYFECSICLNGVILNSYDEFMEVYSNA